MEHQHPHNLIYIKYNQALKTCYNLRDNINLILLDINNSSKWMIGEIDADLKNAEHEIVFYDDNLKWGDVVNASGVGEIKTYTKQLVRTMMNAKA